MSEYGSYGSLHLRRIVTTPHGVFKAPKGAGLAAAATTALDAVGARLAHRERPRPAARAQRRRAG